jgi:UDP-N-acetylglucosamine transferase subunit ALG13
LKEKSIEPIIDDFGIITSGATGTSIVTGFRSSKTLIEAHPTASSDNSSQENHISPLKKSKTEIAPHPITNLTQI